MATVFLTSLSSDYPELTCNINSIRANTNKVKVTASIVRDPEGEIDEFFSTTLYAYNGVVELVDVGKLIEERFREKNIVGTTMMACIIDGIQLDFCVQYCEALMNTDFDLRTGFYTAAPVQIVHRSSMIQLAHWDYGHRRYRVQVVGVGPDGQVATIEREFTRSIGSYEVSFSVYEILRWALNQTEYETDDAIAKVSYFAISYENAQKIFYLVDEPFFLTFCFRNIFNVREYLDVSGIVKQKTKVDRETAVCSGIVLHYDQKTERTYDVTTGPLTIDEVRAIEQLIMSRDVELCCSDNYYRVLITDHTIEQDNEDSTLTSIKFTFRFASERVKFSSDEVDVLSPSRSSIFSQEFTAEFA